MKKIMFLLIMCLSYTALFAYESSPVDVSDIGIYKANEFRKCPLCYADKLGISREQLSSVWGDHYAELDKEVTSLVSNGKLEKAGSNFLKDMFDRVYISHTTPEGYDVYDRLRNEGINVQMADESITFMAFENYIPKEKALNIVFDGFFKNALMGKGEGFPMLNGFYNEVGISVSSGIVVFDDKPYNVYGLYIVYVSNLQ